MPSFTQGRTAELGEQKSSMWTMSSATESMEEGLSGGGDDDDDDDDDE